MIRGLLNWLTARLTGDSTEGDEEAEGDEETEDKRFVPSLLDRSVRYAHGGNSSEGAREIASIQEQAEELEQHQNDR